MNDLEERLSKALNAHVDSELGERRPAPPFQPARMSRRRRAPWLYPLAAAACVAAVVGGGVVIGRLAADHGAPATRPTVSRSVSPSLSPTSTPSPTAPVPSPAARTSPPVTRSTTGSAPPSHPKSVRPTGHAVTLGAATIDLPVGWVARDLGRYYPGPGVPVFPGWCLTPASTPIVKYGCPLSLFAVDPHGNPLDVDLEGGLSANPEYCGQTPSTVQEQYGDRSFGGRAADWRQWTTHCTATGVIWHIEQYVVATGPAYILFSDHADATVHDAMTHIAARSTLPAQTAPVRLADQGYVRSIDVTGSQVRITLDRIVQLWNRVVNVNPATYAYTIPRSVWRDSTRNQPIKVGTRVIVQSDGTRVRSLYPVGP